MKGDPLPVEDHISRYCKPTCISDGLIQATAFMLRPNENSLSVNWLEFFDCPNREKEISEIRNIYSTKFNRIPIHARLAVLNIGQLKETVYIESEDNRNIEILHDPLIENPPDPSHSGIFNLRSDDDFIAELILETILEEYPARG